MKLCFFAVAMAYATALAVHAMRSHWLFDPGGNLVPTDFVAFWAAGRLALEGHAAQAYDWAAHHAMAVEGIGPHTELLPWLNPPSFLVFVAPFAAFGYPVAMVAWLGLTLVPFVVAIRAIVGHEAAWWGALAFPGVVIDIAAGQGGFLTASLVGGGLLLLRERPFAAGLLIGLLTIKPQLGILFPIAFLAARCWPAFAGAAFGAALLAGLSVLVFGFDTWPAFVGSLTAAGDAVLGRGMMGWDKMQSVYGLLRDAGFGAGPATLAQGMLGIALAVGLYMVWRRRIAYDIKAAALAAGILLVEPYVFIYDVPILAVSIAFLIRLALRTGFLSFERATIGAACAALIASPFTGPHLGLCAAILIAILVVRRAAAIEAVSAPTQGSP